MQEQDDKATPESIKNKKDAETDKSIQEGRSAIEVEKTVSGKSPEDLKKDAENWRNEG